MKKFVGTSGWYYSWNKDKNLKWFVENSKLNAVELNASFYRFPFPNQIKGWARIGKDIRWSIKVNRLITHFFKFSEKSFDTWKKFEKLFEPLKNIDFFLFQLPPSFTPKASDKVENFLRKTKLGEMAAAEFRNKEWFKEEWVDWAKKLEITLVSVDAPELPRTIFNTTGNVYIRMHGRTSWYSHDYSDEELKEVAEKISEAKPKKVYVFFNNDHAMLENARRMFKIL